VKFHAHSSQSMLTNFHPKSSYIEAFSSEQNDELDRRQVLLGLDLYLNVIYHKFPHLLIFLFLKLIMFELVL
jgi:hypothetical protein